MSNRMAFEEELHRDKIYERGKEAGRLEVGRIAKDYESELMRLRERVEALEGLFQRLGRRVVTLEDQHYTNT